MYNCISNFDFQSSELWKCVSYKPAMYSQITGVEKNFVLLSHKEKGKLS